MDIETQIIKFQLASKRLERLEQQTETSSKKREAKITQLLKDGKPDVAYIQAKACISELNSAKAFGKLAAQLDALQSRLKLLSAQNNIMTAVHSMIPSLVGIIDNNDPSEMLAKSELFNECIQQLDGRADQLDKTLNAATQSSSGNDDAQVKALLERLADSNAQQMNMSMPTVNLSDLEQRLAKLKN